MKYLLLFALGALGALQVRAQARIELTQAQRDSAVAANYRRNQERLAREEDSLARVAQRRYWVADSLRQAAALAEAEKAPYRTMYVNASTLTMREAATATAAPVLKLHAPAAITVYKEPANAKYAKASYSIDSYTGESRMWDGWVEKAYLVPTRAGVTVASNGAEVEFLPGDPLMPSAVAVSGRNSVAVYGKGASRSVRANGTPVGKGQQYMRGPRGGCYYYSPSGRKVYVDRSLCN